MNTCTAPWTLTRRGQASADAAASRNREEWLARLEEYQRDLEQEIADVADVIRHLKGEQPAETATRLGLSGPASAGPSALFQLLSWLTPHFTGLAKWARGAHFL